MQYRLSLIWMIITLDAISFALFVTLLMILFPTPFSNMILSEWRGLTFPSPSKVMFQGFAIFRVGVKCWKRRPFVYYDAWLTILIGLDVTWRLRNEKIRKNSRVTAMTAIKVISPLVFYYTSILNNVSSNPCSRLRTQDVICFIASSSSILDRNGRSPTAIGTPYSVSGILSLCYCVFLIVCSHI